MGGTVAGSILQPHGHGRCPGRFVEDPIGDDVVLDLGGLEGWQGP